MTSHTVHRRQSGRSTSLTRTMMSYSRLPQEITDYVVDLLHDELEALRQCCLVSRSWVPRTRKHLFGTIRFRTTDNLQAWKEAFPNPLDSPGYHTHHLGIHCTKIIAAVPEECSRIQSFSNVVRLEVWTRTRTFIFTSPYDSQIALHRFSSSVTLTNLQAYLFPASS